MDLKKNKNHRKKEVEFKYCNFKTKMQTIKKNGKLLSSNWLKNYLSSLITLENLCILKDSLLIRIGK